MNCLNLSGRFDIEVYQSGDLVSAFSASNGITTVGKNSVLDIAFRSQSQLSWYIGLIDNTNFSAVNALDTMASHAGWSELTAYLESTRPAWVPAPAANGGITSSSAASFDMVGTAGYIRGVFICSHATKADTSGILWSTAIFDAEYYNSSTFFLVNYTLSS